MWYNDPGPISDIVLSSRVRLARNINSLPFVGKMSPEQQQSSIDLVKLAIAGRMELDFVSLGIDAGARIMACGYGRQSAALAAGQAISEIQAHAAGVVAQTGEKDFLLVDLGGQDSKIIRVIDEKVADFATNDKCAAGSGRYLENMAQVLGISVDELAEHSENPVALSATCAVFGESELIGKIIEGVPTASLAAGINMSVVKRILPLLARYLPAPKIYFAGGVAANTAVFRLLSEMLGQELQPLAFPRHNGAIGCCYLIH